MRIIDLLKKDAIALNVSLATKDEAIDKLVALHDAVGNLNDRPAYREAILAREAQGSTAIGEGIAVPHAKSESVKTPGLAAVTVPEGVDYDAPDAKPSDVLFMIAAPLDGDLHLEILSRLMTMLMDYEFTGKLRAAKTPEEFLAVIDKAEAEKYPDEPKEEAKAADGYRLLAVTACPTGIAHTYMAAEALQKAADEMGVTLKVETAGSGGVKNALTKAEIAAADAIILAIDRGVEMARFDGKKVLKTAVSNGIHKPKELLEKALAGELPVYHADEADKSADSGDEKENFGRKIYKHLMNGVSHMLPFVVGGGVLIALGFLIDTILGNATVNGEANGAFGFTSFAASVPFWLGKVAFGMMLPILSGFIAHSIADRPGLLPGVLGGLIAANGYTFQSMFENKNLVGDGNAVSGFLGALFAGFLAGLVVLGLKKLFAWMPKAMDGIKPVFLYPLFGAFITGSIMCLVNPFIGALNNALNNGLTALGNSTSGVVLCIVLAGMMAIDMGGPFNKVAYVFGTAAIASGNTWIMAAVMIGGMVPPIAIALATSVNKTKWTAEERKSGPVNYLMGLCFITEGAIPYAASDPLRVIPSCVVGSAAAGAVSYLLGCACPAPHGGIFTFAVVTNPLGYFGALVVGSVVGAAMLLILKKNINKA